ncbi:MAG: hypothetical protein PHU19_03260 [Bacteroidales bacterium]|nr:hypothetical protein [Bacteroidales bacterium]
MSVSPDNLDDRELVRLALENRQEAYTRLLVRHKDRVQAFINKLIVNSSESEDLVLMSFDKAFRNLKHTIPNTLSPPGCTALFKIYALIISGKTNNISFHWKKHGKQKILTRKKS